MPRCSICLQVRSLKFRTGRLSICPYCVSSLNNSMLSGQEARNRWRLKFRDGVLRNQPEAISWLDGWLDRCADSIAAQQMNDPAMVRRSHELKVMRAFRRGLVCRNRSYLSYPANWDYKRYRTKHLDGYACHVCGARESDGAPLHVHHIVFRSNSGTNSYRNLVTLCFKHHQALHDHPITTDGGEPRGTDVDQTVEEIDALCTESAPKALPSNFEEAAYAAVLPTFELAMEAFYANGKSARELFSFLILTFGRNVGRYALHFASEKRREGRWY